MKIILENMNNVIGLADEIIKTRTQVKVGEFKLGFKDKVDQALHLALANIKPNEATETMAQPRVTSRGAT